MKRRDFIKKCGMISGLLLSSVMTNCNLLENRKSNFIVIISDDAGYADFGFTNNKIKHTPNIDKLANQGTIFKQGYVTAAVCCPSRMGLITGKYQQRFGAECNCPFEPTPGFTKGDLGLDLEEKSIADFLKPHGYKSTMIGKWHLGEEEHHHPLNRGFDECFGFLSGSRSFWPLKNPSHGAAIYKNDKIIDETNTISYTTDNFTDSAIDFIDRNKNNPFFIYLSYNAVHTPMHAKEEDIEHFSEVAPEKRKIYSAMTKSLDENIEKLVSKLKNEKLIENTLLFFVNDNGGATNNASDNTPLRGHKGTYFEGGIKVPFFISWKSKLKSKQEYNYPVSSLDILPTLLSAANINYDNENFDGVNLIPYLKGDKQESPHEFLYWRFWHVSAVRYKNWKLLKVADNPLQEDRKLLQPLALFDLQTDPFETENVAEKNPQIMDKLYEKLLEWESTLSQPRWYDGNGWEHWAKIQLKNHQL